MLFDGFTSLIKIMNRVEELNDLVKRCVPKGDNIAHYLAYSPHALPINHARPNCQLIYTELISRAHDELPVIGATGQDMKIIRRKHDLLKTNNHAYGLACKYRPHSLDVMEFFALETCAIWGVLMSAKARAIVEGDSCYYGLQPFGINVITYLNQELGYSIGRMPTYKDHVDLMNLTNKIARLTNLTTYDVNTCMYLAGQDILANPNASVAEEDTE